MLGKLASQHNKRENLVLLRIVLVKTQYPVGGCFGEQAVAVHYRAYNLISVKGSTNKNQGLLFRANQTFYSRQAAKSFCMLLLAEQTSNQIDSVWLGLFAASQQTNAFNDARYHYIIFFSSSCLLRLYVWKVQKF